MSDKLSNSVLLRQIIPKVKSTIDPPPKEKEVCSIRQIRPAELVAAYKEEKKQLIPSIKPKPEQIEPQEQSNINDELIEKLERLRARAEFDTILKGSKLGLSAYQKPKGGIPKKDLSKELQRFIDRTEAFMNKKPQECNAFGIVHYDKFSRKINFYSPTDTAHTKVLGSVDVTKFPSTVLVDKTLNITSNNAIANSTVTNSLQTLDNLIPRITVYEEILKIDKK